MNENENETLDEVIQKWQNANNIHRYEGTKGVDNFQKLCRAIGYEDGNYFGYNNEIVNFLSDNPGAIEAMISWIAERENPDWKQNLIELIDEYDSLEAEGSCRN